MVLVINKAPRMKCVYCVQLCNGDKCSYTEAHTGLKCMAGH